jgi:putative sterol carrier protein
MQITVAIDKGTLQVQEGLVGKADCQVTADSATWLAFLRKEQKLIGPLLRGKVRIKGAPRLLMTFGQMFGA